MSFIEHVKCEIYNISALEQGANDLGLLFHRDQTSFQHYGSITKPCKHAIRVPADMRHEIGVVQIGDGVYEMQFDSDSRAIAGVMGDLTQRYQFHNVQSELPEGVYLESVEEDPETGNLLVWTSEN